MNGYHEYWFTVSLRNNIGDEILCCPTGSEANCRVKFNWHYTPLYYGMSPNVMYYDQKTTMIVDPRAAPENRLSGSFLHAITMRIDDHEINTNPFTDEEVTDQENLTSWVRNYVKGYVKTESATSEASVTAWFHGSGNAVDVATESTTCLVDGTTCYDAQILPVIHNIDKTSGFTSGG